MQKTAKVRAWTRHEWCGKYGNRFVRIGKWFEAQISGHNHIADLRIGFFEFWFAPTTGRLIHWRIIRG